MRRQRQEEAGVPHSRRVAGGNRGDLLEDEGVGGRRPVRHRRRSRRQGSPRLRAGQGDIQWVHRHRRSRHTRRLPTGERESVDAVGDRWVRRLLRKKAGRHQREEPEGVEELRLLREDSRGAHFQKREDRRRSEPVQGPHHSRVTSRIAAWLR